MTDFRSLPSVAPATDRPWTALPSHRNWLRDQARELTGFARASVRPEGGFCWLDDDGVPDPREPLQTWITCRMTHVFALANLQGEPGAGPIADHGVAALTGLLRDREHGGWFTSVAGDGTPVDDGKAAYPHAFVVLAASSASQARRPGAAELLESALDVVAERFWDEDAGRTKESWSADWAEAEPYRGANSSMHMVEAFLAAGTATGDARWYGRALRICEHLIHDVAARHDWRMPEHFSAAWEPLLDYNADQPADQFRPFGSTIGHWLEWSRLLLHVESALPDPPAWLLSDARALFHAAVRRGWAVDGADGLVYTVAWDDKPVVRARMHWVIAEGIAAAAVLRSRTGEPIFEAWYRTFWDYAEQYVIDRDRGSWRHELNADNEPADSVWRGKPDIYHAYQAVLVPMLPLRPTLAGAVAEAARTSTSDATASRTAP
jgi:mannose/cellobiose epimerase-like protein (N-acyl-D-glucosamine 2-epimerase family)